MAVHDEGSCWVPAVLRPAIVLTHWVGAVGACWQGLWYVACRDWSALFCRHCQTAMLSPKVVCICPCFSAGPHRVSTRQRHGVLARQLLGAVHVSGWEESSALLCIVGIPAALLPGCWLT